MSGDSLKLLLRHRMSAPDWANGKALRDLQPVHLPRVVRELERVLADSDGTIPQPIELNEVLQVVWRHWGAHGRIDDLPRRYQRLLPWVIFYSPGDLGTSKDWLGARPAFVQSIAAFIEQSKKPSFLVSIAKAFLRSYPVELETFEAWRVAIVKGLDRSRGPRPRLWSDRNARWRLFEKDGVSAFASELWKATEPPEEFLAEAGLVGDLGEARFIERAVASMLTVMNGHLRDRVRPSPEQLHRGLSVLETGDRRLRYPGLRQDVAQALLEPFTGAEPSEELQRLLEGFLLHHYGDPRIKKANWYGVPAEHQAVMRRWLVRESYEAFFRVVDETALDRHWAQRRRFWDQYFKAGSVIDAWVVFGDEAAGIATARLSMNRSQFGRLKNPYEASQSVLLLRVAGPRGTVEIAEWSHNGKVRGWPLHDRSAPRFHEPDYDAQRLRAPAELERTHDQWGNWMSEVARWVATNTGVTSSGGGR